MGIGVIVSGVKFDAAANLFLGGGGTSVTGNTGSDKGTDNIAMGGRSWDNGTTQVALAAVTDGVGNVAIGGSCLPVLTTGSFNICIGDAVGLSLTTGNGNVGIGDYALTDLISGNKNVGVGETALSGVTTGNGNVGIGDAAGYLGVPVTTGIFNTFLGWGARTTKATINHAVAIGVGAEVNNDNQCMIGGTATSAPDSADARLCIIFAGATAPADADLVASQGSLYWDFTNGAGKLKIKMKTANGTVMTGEVALT